MTDTMKEEKKKTHECGTFSLNWTFVLNAIRMIVVVVIVDFKPV